MTGGRVSLQTLQLIIVYLIRQPKMLEAAMRVLKPEHFYTEGVELGYARLYEITVDYYEKYEQMPPRHVLITEFQKVLDALPDYMSTEQVEDSFNLIENAFHPSMDHTDRNWKWALEQLRLFVEERVVADPLRRHLDAGVPLPEVVTRLTNNWASTRIQPAETIDPFQAWREADPSPRIPTGAQWFDMLTEGGIYQEGGETFGLLGGVGWGKTISGVHLGVSLAKRGHHILYACYEQPVSGHMGKDMNQRVVACSSGIDKKRIQDRTSLTPEELAIISKASDQVNSRFRFLDMSGIDPGIGTGGVAEVGSYLSAAASDGNHVSMVIIDWFGYMLDRIIGAETFKDSGTSLRRMLVRREIGLCNSLAGKFKTNFFVLHQSSTDVLNARCTRTPSLTDAEEAKNFPQLMQWCFSMSKPTEGEEAFAILKAVKARPGRQVQLTIKRLHETSSFQVVNMIPDGRAGSDDYIKPEDQDRIPSEKFTPNTRPVDSSESSYL